MIPKNIWQTWKSHDLPVRVAAYARTWKQLNPTWQHALHDDEECREDVKKFGDPELLLVYDKMPLPVMRADIWRYLIVYEHGGLYSDIDTSCSAPLDSWFPGDAEFIVGLENACHLCQWTFAAAPRHPALGRLLRMIVERGKGAITMRPHAVHYYTGPGIFTSVLSGGMVFNVTGTKDDRPNERGFHVYREAHFHGEVVEHHYGGQWDQTPGYTGWVIQQNSLSHQPGTMEKTFSTIYDKDVWGGSGPGSSPEYCAPFADFLSKYISDSGVKSFCDLGCGDLRWMPGVVAKTGVSYIGVDCVRALIDKHSSWYVDDPRYSFWHLDLSQADAFPDADMYMIKDVLQHWPSDAVAVWLNKFFSAKPDARLLVVNCGGQTVARDLSVGGWAPLDPDKYPMWNTDAKRVFTWASKNVYEVRPRADLRAMECATLSNGTLRRIGRNSDGGYVVADGVGTYDRFLSGGVGDDVSFERALLSLHPDLQGVVFDGSVDALPGGPCARLEFRRQFIGPDHADLRAWMASYRDVFIKLDIEGGEVWQMRSLSPDDMMKIKQLVIEFHNPWDDQMDILMKLRSTHDLVHVHANNCSPIRRHKGSTVPCVFEATYIRKQKDAQRSRVPLPRSIDLPNTLGAADILLRGYPWPS